MSGASKRACLYCGKPVGATSGEICGPCKGFDAPKAAECPCCGREGVNCQREAPEPEPCADCVEVHGDEPDAWLAEWPEGAEWRDDLDAFLCDGCADERLERARQRDAPYFESAPGA